MSSGAPHSSAKLVLLVDDDDAVRRVVTRMLGLNGFAALAAASGEEALGVLRDQPSCEATIIDVVMPGSTGTQTLASLREVIPNLPCVFISGYEIEALGTQLPLDQRTQYLTKPFRKEALLQSLRDVIQGGSIPGP